MFKLLIMFIIINFCVSFIFDLILNKLKLVKELEVYYEDKSDIMAGCYAGLSIVVGLLMTMLLSFILLGFIVPKNLMQLSNFLIIAFLVGYMIYDIIFKYNIFGNSLRPFYLKYGSGFTGSLSFVLCIFISYIIIKLLKIKR